MTLTRDQVGAVGAQDVQPLRVIHGSGRSVVFTVEVPRGSRHTLPVHGTFPGSLEEFNRSHGILKHSAVCKLGNIPNESQYVLLSLYLRLQNSYFVYGIV